MSEHGFHVHGPHDHAVEHAAHGGDDGFASKVAVLTAVLSTIGALFSYEGGHTQNGALLFKNEAAIQKTAAANQWSYYQAKGNKLNLSELGMELSSDARKPFFEAERKRYEAQKVQIRKAAEKLEQTSAAFDARSAQQMHQHHRWAQATMLLQIAIAMAAIALLSRRAWLGKLVVGMGAVGIVIGALAYFGV